MSLRAQLTLLTALAVAAAVIVASAVLYVATRATLRDAVDDSLVSRAQEVADAPSLTRHGPEGSGEKEPSLDPFAERDFFFQVVNDDGAIVAQPDTQVLSIPVGEDDVAVASGVAGSFMRDVTTDGLHLRVIISPGEPGEAVQVARSLEEVDASLSELRNILFVVGGAGVAIAAALGLIVAQRTLRPVARLTEAAEHVAATQDLDAETPIEVRRRDELGRLATSFNDMLAALRESRLQQQQLVSDASHELRTPLTSLRTNIEVLQRSDVIPEAERRDLLHDVTFELEELTKLVAELVELASEKRVETQSFEDVRLDELAASVVGRAARRSGLPIALNATPSLVVGNLGLLERAAANLVDNACKWSPPGAAIDVTVADGVFEVRDRGPGIPHADLPRVFDRFYRAGVARSKPGSGLGLAIVKQIIEAHAGSVWVKNAPDTGTIAGFQLGAVAVSVEAPASTRTAPASP